MNKILVIVDMQNSFINPQGILYIKDAEILIEKLHKFLISVPKGFFNAIIITQDTHKKEDYILSEESKMFPLHCENNTWDWQLAFDETLIQNKSKVYKLYKDVFDMWATNNNSLNNNLFHLQREDESISLPTFMNRYEASNSTVYLIGVASDYCNKYAIDGFLKNNYSVCIIEELTKGINADTKTVTHQFYQKYLTSCQLKVIDTKNLFTL